MRTDGTTADSDIRADRDGDLARLEQSCDAMGTTFSLVLYGNSQDELLVAADAAFEELRRLDHMLSNYRAESEWSQMNREAGHRAVNVSEELFHLLIACEEYCRASEGVFDITVGPLMKIWGFYKGTGRLPAPAEVQNALQMIGREHVRLDRRNQTVQFDDASVELDPGGIGKGYAVDRMVDVLKENGLASGLVVGSGSSIYGLGSPPGQPQGWRATIGDPRDPRKPVAEVFLKDMSLSTSGSYEKVFFAEGRTYSHIIDPRTGYPAQGTSLVSVLGPRAVDTEAWTKPYFIRGGEWAASHKPAGFSIFVCNQGNSACKWIGEAGATTNVETVPPNVPAQ